MNIFFLTTVLLFSCFFENLTATLEPKLLLGTVSYTDESRCRCVEEWNKPNQYDLMITHSNCAKETEKLLRESIQQIIPDATIVTSHDQKGLSIRITFNAQCIQLKLEQRETIEGKKRITLCIYDKRFLSQLEQMTKKPILQYAINQKILSVIA